ncbi:hypothetical protein mRhiFer1_007875 [Rhinolophus ferrumequinum]|uniref:Uncharacterized protein n=1 Tax=Rhinolophus ferrumequinum TaxID=59479 RepID=A0A7J8AVK2_RHIFE|nr:hypothetical protein mRhiFer1_007875 [Rhinolophus ferrumequinum]
MHTHSPTWDDCQQLLKTLFTTEEHERILTEARKNVPGDKGRLTTLPNLIDECLPLNRPDWDFGNAEAYRIHQYPMSAKARKGIAPHINHLLEAGILKPCHSAWNTPLLPVKKPGGKDYRSVQDLREVNKRVEDIHPTVPNPYTLLSHLPPSHVWYTTLDLKDAFFSIALTPSSQHIFAFECHDCNTGTPGQLTWTRLPQSFKNSPTLFNEALNQDLDSFRQSHTSVTLLQYVDDLLLAAPSEAECRRATRDLLQELGQLGYRANAKKAQICRQTVTYLGYKLKEGTRWLAEAMKETILRLPVPTSAREVREFLGTTGYCRLWILGYAEIVKPLYKATKDKVPWAWGSDQKKAYDELKVAFLRAPALALPDPLKPFTLFVDERRGIAKGVLMQHLGPWKRPVAYLSKKLDPVAAGWPPCLRIIAAVALIVKDADKLTFGQHLKVVTPYAIEGVLKYPPGRWMSNALLTHYQGLLLDAPRIIFAEPTALNPATLLPTPDLRAPLHDCQEIMAEVTQVRLDLQDTILPNSELVWYTDGSSFIIDGVRKAGAAVVDKGGHIIWSASLSLGTSAQKAELIVLVEALERAEGRRVTVYTDSRYAFGTVHVNGAIYRESGFVTAEGKALCNLPEVRRLLMAVQMLRALAVVHIPGHQSAWTPEAEGNQRVDEAAKAAAVASSALALTQPTPDLPHLPPRPDYTPEDLRWIQNHHCPEPDQQGWHQDTEGRLILPAQLGLFLLSNLHQATHLGKKKLLTILESARLRFPRQAAQIQEIIDQCVGCQAMRPSRKGPQHTDHDPNVAPSYLASLKALQGVQHEIWSLVHSLCEIKDAPNPEHGIVPGDWHRALGPSLSRVPSQPAGEDAS